MGNSSQGSTRSEVCVCADPCRHMGGEVENAAGPAPCLQRDDIYTFAQHQHDLFFCERAHSSVSLLQVFFCEPARCTPGLLPQICPSLPGRGPLALLSPPWPEEKAEKKGVRVCVCVRRRVGSRFFFFFLRMRERNTCVHWVCGGVCAWPGKAMFVAGGDTQQQATDAANTYITALNKNARPEGKFKVTPCP